MQQIQVTKQNGVTLTEVKTIGIDPEKIVTTRDVDGVAEILYAEKLDRRVKPLRLLTTNTKTVIDGLITGSKTDFTVYNVAEGTTSTLTVQDKFIQEMKDTYFMINGTKTACLQITYAEGAFISNVIYASETLNDVATAVVTTTTTTAAATTTTTVI